MWVSFLYLRSDISYFFPAAEKSKQKTPSAVFFEAKNFIAH